MTDRPITGRDALLYLDHVAGHGLHEDTRWLVDAGRFPVGCRVLDVGCGTGTLVAELAGDRQFARSVIGVELSPELATHARRAAAGADATVVQADFLSWTPPAGWRPDTVVMSYFLHHTEDPGRHLRRAADLLPHGGRLYVLDRVAVDQDGLDAFPQFWEEHYRAAHEWDEEMPRLMTAAGLEEVAGAAGFDFVQRLACPHDCRPGAAAFPKTLMEFWRHESGRSFPAVLLVSPTHQDAVGEIVRELGSEGLHVAVRHGVRYTGELVRTIYERCPWREKLALFVGEVCPDGTATALSVAGDDASPDLLHRLSLFKKDRRDRWKRIDGPAAEDGVRAMILPFHVAEPYESEALARLIGLTGGR